MELQLIGLSFFAGILTILAPCILPLLPILIGTSTDQKANRNRAFTIIISLLATVALLTLIIYGTSNALGLSTGFLRFLSGIIILIVGASMVFPSAWQNLSVKLGLEKNSNGFLARAMNKQGKGRDILIGMALGPVFSSCSPTYGLIIGTILPENFVQGFIYLGWYLLGLGLTFVLIALVGQRITRKLQWATNPDGWFKRSIGVLFLIIGFAIIFNFDKNFEAWLLNADFYTTLIEFELDLN